MGFPADQQAFLMFGRLQIQRSSENLLEEAADRSACERPFIARYKLLQHRFFTFRIKFRYALLFFYDSNFLYNLGTLRD
ncbi:hypothetical protein D3C74_403090 [compost metagenome]